MTAKVGEILVGLDVGTTKICAVVGEVNEDGIDIIGVGSAPSQGVRNGVIVNIDAAANAVQRAIEDAEVMAGCDISSVYMSISGGHIKGYNSHGVAPVKHGEVDKDDIERVIESAKAIAIPTDREVLHVLPQEYILDNVPGIIDPMGMSGVRLETHVHIVTGSVTSAQNLIKCAERCQLETSDIVLSQLASSEAVLTPDEKELGCAVIDIGGGTTDIAIWSKGTVVHTSVLSLGGTHLTNDIGAGLSISMAEAERVKISKGCAMESAVGADEIMEVPSIGGREPNKIPRRLLSNIIEPRMEEILSLAYKEIEASGFKEEIVSGIVITGGTSFMDAVPELAGRVMGLPVRRGVPKGIDGLADNVRNPKYATAVGLLLYGMKNPENPIYQTRDKKSGSWLKGLIEWVKTVI